jgi:hypothetical protein
LGTPPGRHTGRPWRLSTITVGVSVCENAKRYASAVSFAPAGRITLRFGCARSIASCSIGWCVGPSSPRPIESWVKMNTEGIRITDARRIAPFM